VPAPHAKTATRQAESASKYQSYHWRSALLFMITQRLGDYFIVALRAAFFTADILVSLSSVVVVRRRRYN